jgi:hypothetical protein
MAAQLFNAADRPVEIVETGEPLRLNIAVRFHRTIESPVIGFLISNRHGIHAYGTNSKEQQIDPGTVKAGSIIELSFAFNCWLGIDQYSISLAAHSMDGQAFDWMDGVFFFRVVSSQLVEGVANLNATAVVRRLGNTSSSVDASVLEQRLETVSDV